MSIVWRQIPLDMNTQNIPLAIIHHTENNPRTITDHGMKTLIQSITDHGFNQPIVLNHDMTIIDGNQRVRAMEQIGSQTIPAIVVNVDQDTAIKMNIQFNTVGGRHDFDVLANHFEPEYLFACGFDHFELGLIRDHETDDPDQDDNKPAKKYRFAIICDDMAEIRVLRAFYESKGRRITFNTWNERTNGKQAETDNDDNDDTGFGGVI